MSNNGIRASSGVEVKGLEWFVIDETWERAQTLFGLTYDATNRGWYNTVSRFVPCTDLKQSKAAAEADHRQRVLSGLSSPLPTVEVTEEMLPMALSPEELRIVLGEAFPNVRPEDMPDHVTLILSQRGGEHA